MANNNSGKAKKPSLASKLFLKLDLSKDERLTRTPIETGRISHFFSTFKKNYSELMLANLLFMLFALPAVLVIFWLTPNIINSLNGALDFNGDMGIGFGGKYDTIQGMVNIYSSYETMLLILIPCFSLAGLGMAGLFYVSRNLLWGAPVKIRVHFFRGIKKRWAEYLLSFTDLGGVVCMMGCSVLEYLKADALGTTHWGHWVFMIVSAIVFLLSIMYLIISLPMMMSFRYKFASNIKNSVLLTITMFPIILILIIVLSLPMLFMMNSFLRIIFYVAVAMIGFSFYVLAVSALGHNVYDSTIIPLFEHEQQLKEKEERRERARQNRAQGSAKKRKRKKK